MAKYQGFFKPTNKHKYKGNPDQIVYRSGWELKFFRYCDANPDILEWSSEEVIVPYTCATDKKTRRYFPDVVLKQRTVDGKVETVMIEIKPEKETVPPKLTKTKTERQLIKEALTFAKNTSKWNAAEQFCRHKGWRFKIMTEVHLGIKRG